MFCQYQMGPPGSSGPKFLLTLLCPPLLTDNDIENCLKQLHVVLCIICNVEPSKLTEFTEFFVAVFPAGFPGGFLFLLCKPPFFNFVPHSQNIHMLSEKTDSLGKIIKPVSHGIGRAH